MCELYELGGWEGGADELREQGPFWLGSSLILLFERIGMGFYSICIAMAQLDLKFVGRLSGKILDDRYG